MKNLLIYSLLFLFRLFPQKEPQEGRFLILSTTGLGDTLWGTPAIRALKKSHPKAYIAVLTSPVGQKLLTHNPYIDKLYLLKNGHLAAIPKLIRALRKERFSAVLIFHTSQRLALPLAKLTGAKKIIGTTGINKGLDRLLTHKVAPVYEHEIARRLRIVKEAGVEECGPEMEIFLTLEEKKAAAKVAARYKKPIIALHPGSKDAFKRWPSSHFIRLGQNLSENYQVVVTGDQSEKRLTETIASAIPGAESLAGKLSLRHMAAFLPHLERFVTNDTGPMHMAFAAKVPTDALFSPTDPKLCGPYHVPNARLHFAPKTCTPCLRKKCKDPFCMRQITVSDNR